MKSVSGEQTKQTMVSKCCHAHRATSTTRGSSYSVSVDLRSTKQLSSLRAPRAPALREPLVSRNTVRKNAPEIPKVAPPHFCAHISLSPSPLSSPEKHGESPDPPPMAGTLPAAARAHITRCSSGLNLLNRRVVAVTMLYVPPHRLRMPIALRLANFHDWGTGQDAASC